MLKHIKVVAGIMALTLVFSGGLAIGRANIAVTEPVTASAYKSYTYGDFDYTLDGDEVEIIACNRDVKDAVIPSEIDGMPVKMIETNAFLDRVNLESVTIPDSVETICYEAFMGCTNLKSVTIPDSVINIPQRTFEGCTSLESVTLGKYTMTIGDNAFSKCSALTSVVIPDTVRSIGERAFAYCENLSDITIPESLTKFGTLSFEGTEWLANKRKESQEEDKFVIVNNVIIDAVNCTGDVVIPDGVTSIGGFLLSHVTSVTIPDSVTEIGDYAFYGCNYLESITIPESVEFIGDSAFFDSSVRIITIMNPDCTIYDSRNTLDGAIVNAPENSKAKEYAEKYDLRFIALGEELPEIPDTPATIKKGDINEDGYIDPVDASIILTYYAYSSTTDDKPVMTLDEFMNSDLF